MNTLLVVDDERIIREGIAGQIRHQFAEELIVFTAATGEEALSLIHSRNPTIDIVLTDIVMPEFTGLELIAQCRAEHIECEFLILSSYDDFRYAQEAIKNEVCAYILKPCAPEELHTTVSTVLQKVQKKVLSVMSVLPTFATATSVLKSDEYRVYTLILPDSTETAKRNTTLDSLQKKLEPLFEDVVLYTEHDFLHILIAQRNTQAGTVCAKLKEAYEMSATANIAPIFVSTPVAVHNTKSPATTTLTAVLSKNTELAALVPYFENKSIVYADNVQLSAYSTDNDIDRSIQTLVDAIKNTDSNAASKCIHSIWKMINTHAYDLDSVKRICIKIHFEIAQYAGNSDKQLEIAPLFQKAHTAKALRTLQEQAVQTAIRSRKGKAYTYVSRTIQTAIDYMTLHLSDTDLSLQKVAHEAVFKNSDYVGKIFKKETGVKFSSYLFALRMERAKELLTTTDCTVIEIAEQTGFMNNPSYFSHLFKQVTNMTPSAYRATNNHMRKA